MPARLSALVRALATFGLVVEEPSSGSHWKVRASDGKMFPLPAHNGLRSEISDKYIRALCRQLAVDEGELRSKL